MSSEFGSASGLVMNLSMSMIYFGGVSANVKESILRTTAMQKGILPMRYLGFTLHHRTL